MEPLPTPKSIDKSFDELWNSVNEDVKKEYLEFYKIDEKNIRALCMAKKLVQKDQQLVQKDQHIEDLETVNTVLKNRVSSTIALQESKYYTINMQT